MQESARGAPELVAGRRLLLDCVIVSLWIVLTDWLLYRVQTFVAWSVFLAFALLYLPVIRLSFPAIRQGGSRKLPALAMGLLLLFLAGKLAWCGSMLQIAAGCFVLAAYTMALSGVTPFLPEIFKFCMLVIAGAFQRLSRFRVGQIPEASGNLRASFSGSVLVPLGLVLCFASLFILANPDVSKWIGVELQLLATQLQSFFAKFTFGEIVFWTASGVLILGLVYPKASELIREVKPMELSLPVASCPQHPMTRNTLLSLSLLFAGYLVFEFATLWFREFPKNFYYAGYAHQGAFWLTVALALSTVVLSVVFRGPMLQDPKLRSLKTLACVWAILNFLLVAAVVNRLFIYID